MRKVMTYFVIVVVLMLFGLSSGNLLPGEQTKNPSQKSLILNIAQKIRFQKGLKKITDKVVAEGKFSPALSNEYSHFLKENKHVVGKYKKNEFLNLFQKTFEKSIQETEQKAQYYQDKLKQFNKMVAKLSEFQITLQKIIEEAEEKNISKITDLPSDVHKRIKAIQYYLEENHSYFSQRVEKIKDHIKNMEEYIRQKQRELRATRRTTNRRTTRAREKREKNDYYRPAKKSMYELSSVFFDLNLSSTNL